MEDAGKLSTAQQAELNISAWSLVLSPCSLNFSDLHIQTGLHTMQEAQGGYSGGSLLLAAAGSCLLGIGLGYHVAKRELAVVAGKGAAPRNGRAVPRLHLGGGANGGGYGSLDSTPSATPRSLSRSDIAAGSGLRMVLLMRTDVPLVSASRQHCCCSLSAPPLAAVNPTTPHLFPAIAACRASRRWRSRRPAQCWACSRSSTSGETQTCAAGRRGGTR